MISAGLPLTLTPSVSQAIALQDHEKVKKYISQSLRYLLLLILPVTAVMAATSTELLTFFYSSAYAPAASVLSLLVVSAAFLFIFTVFGSIVTGRGNPKMEMYWSVGIALALSLLNIVLIPRYGMMGSAWASVMTSFLAAIIAGGYVYWKFKTLTNLFSVLRISVISFLIFFLAWHWHYSGIALIITYLLLGILYILLLFLFGELKKEDFHFVKKLMLQRHEVKNNTS